VGDVIRVTISIEIPAGTEPPRVTVTEHPSALTEGPASAACSREPATDHTRPGDSAGQQAGGGSDASTGPPVASATPATALEALERFSVVNAAALVQTYAPQRILAVCRAAANAGGRKTNPAGWILAALRRGWTV